MGGVAGVLVGNGAQPASREEGLRMAAMLLHRGPDGWGIYRDRRVALVHTHRSVAASPAGRQPLSSDDGQLCVVVGGSIYNERELRRELEACGHRFRSSSVAEVVLRAYEQWGDEAWPRLNGQFAVALWDAAGQRLRLVRDRFGISPLYWAHCADAVAFASEAKALFAGGRIAPAFDAAGLAQVFTRWSVVAPDTVFTGVRSVLPGGALVIEADLRIREWRYWQPHIVPRPQWQCASPREFAAALGAALDGAVRLHLRGDASVGCYVGGGLDSAVIAALAARASPLPVPSYAIRFANPAFDETPQQRLIARLCRTRHHEFLCDEAGIADALADVVWHCETPLLRSSPVPLFLLSRLVRRSGRKVVLTGEGADDLLGGYGIFKEDRIRRFWARQPTSRLRPQLLDRLYAYVGGERSRSGALWRRFFAVTLAEIDHPFYSHLIRWQNTAWSLRLLARDVRAALDPEAMMASLAATLPTDWRQWEPLARAQLIEMNTFLSSYLLSSQGDRVAMAHGIEMRYPFLDADVVDLCCALPSRAKLLGLRDKVALRHYARQVLPAELATRPRRPYRAPVAAVLFGATAPHWVAAALELSALRRCDLIDEAAARLLIRKARQRHGAMGGEREQMGLMGLLTLQLLAQHFLEEFPQRAQLARQALASIPPTVVQEGACREGEVA